MREKRNQKRTLREKQNEREIERKESEFLSMEKGRKRRESRQKIGNCFSQTK
jgi:hypothetical protein